MRAPATLLCLLLLAGCASPPPAGRPGAAPAAEIPRVDLEAAEPSVRERLEKRISELEERRRQGADAKVLAASWGRLGASYLAQGFGDAAAECFVQSEKLDPGNYAWPYLRGHSLRVSSRNEEMLAAFRRAAELAPEDVPSLVWVAEAESSLENAAAAREFAERALRLDPDNAMALFRLGQLAADDEDFERAERLLSRALEVQPDADRIRRPLGLALRELGRMEEAEAQLKLAGSRKPGQPDPILQQVELEKTGPNVLVNTGAQAFQRGDVEEALGLFARAVELDPENASAHGNLGAALLRLGRDDDAHFHLKRAVELAPGDAGALFNLGTFYAKHERDDLAAAHFQEAIEADPTHEAARFNLANAFRRRGRCEDAIAHYDYLIERSPSHVEARLARAVCLKNLTRWEPALEALESLRTLVPEDARVLNLEARILACCPDDTLRDPDKARALATEAMRIQPWPDHARTLALAYHALGDVEKALEWARGAADAVERAGQEDAALDYRQTVKQIEGGYPCRTP